MSEYITTEIQTTEEGALAVLPEREIELTKVKLDKFNNLYAEYTIREKGISSEVTRKTHQPAHQDLVKAFERLTVHLCLMTEVVSGIRWGEDQYLQDGALMAAFQDEAIYTASEFESYRCTGFTMVSGGVVLVGQKKLRSKKVLNLVSPFEVFEPETPTGNEYYHLDYLDGDVQQAVEEVRAYLDGKYSDDGRQLDMFDEVQEKLEVVVDHFKQKDLIRRSFEGKELDDE
jgi:hypothetical protein